MTSKKITINEITDEHVAALLARIPKNIYRLLQDSILLYNQASYPSSFALAVYALEEIGKAFMLATILNPTDAVDSTERTKLLSKALFEHTSKQREALKAIGGFLEKVDSFAAFNSLLWGIANKYDSAKLSTIYRRAVHAFRDVELKKRRSIYVDMDGLSPSTPCVAKNEAFDALDTCIDALAIFVMVANDKRKNPWLTKIIYSGKVFAPRLEEVIELSRLIHVDRFEDLFNEMVTTDCTKLEALSDSPSPRS